LKHICHILQYGNILAYFSNIRAKLLQRRRGGGREKATWSSNPRASELLGERRAPSRAPSPRAAGSMSLHRAVVELRRWRACLPHGEWQPASGELRPGLNSSPIRSAAASTALRAHRKLAGAPPWNPGSRDPPESASSSWRRRVCSPAPGVDTTGRVRTRAARREERRRPTHERAVEHRRCAPPGSADGRQGRRKDIR
jgi:hypothetical protein